MAAPTRILIHHRRAEAMAEVVGAVARDVLVETVSDYPGLGPALARFAPEILLTVRFAGTPDYPRAAIHGSPSLRWIAAGGSGVDHLGAWNPSVMVTNAAGVGASVIAEFAMAAIYAFAMEMPAFRVQQAAGIWRQIPLRPLGGATALVVGLGHVGSAIAALARRNGMRVLGIRARAKAAGEADETGTAEDLPAFAARADYVVVALPLTAATRGLIGRGPLAAMRPDAVLVNLARGGVVDEPALLGMLREGRLRGAALDVFGEEPLPPDHPFWTQPNVLVTPHNAIAYPGWEADIARHFCANLARWQRGEPLTNVVRRD